MKKIVSFLGLPFVIIFVISSILVIFSGLLIFRIVDLHIYNPQFPAILGACITIILLCAFALSVIYLVVGIAAYVGDTFRKRNTKWKKRFVIRGIVGVLISFVLFFLLSLVLSNSGLSINTNHRLPGVLEFTGEKFPISDLQIVALTVVESGDYAGWCEVSLKNSNPTFHAANVKFRSNITNEEFGLSRNNIYPNNTSGGLIMGEYPLNSCSQFSLSSAESALVR